MGRGRAKAKQQKVARRLKYSAAGSTDLDRLRSELGVAEEDVSPSGPSEQSGDTDEDPYDDLVDRYADYAEQYPSGDDSTGEGSERSDGFR